MPETILIVYAGIVLAQKGGGLPAKRHRYYLLDSKDRAIEDDDTCTFHFAKKLWGSHGIGSILTVQREEDSFSNSKFKTRSEQQNRMFAWSAQSRANEEEHRKIRYLAKKGKEDPFVILVDQIAEGVKSMGWQERRALVSYILEKIL